MQIFNLQMLIINFSSNIYIKWAWSDTTLSKASKVNLIKIFKYFLDREPSENSTIFNKIYTAFIQSIIKVDERFLQVLLNALLHLMKHLFYILVKKEDGTPTNFLRPLKTLEML